MTNEDFERLIVDCETDPSAALLLRSLNEPAPRQVEELRRMLDDEYIRLAA